MHESSRQGVGLNCQSAAVEQPQTAGQGDVGHPQLPEADRPGHHGYYTYRTGEGIVFVPYGLSPNAR